MKRLKYSCPFGGKIYPFYLALFSSLIPMFGLMFTGSGPFFRLILMFACPFAVLTACFFMEQSLTDDERIICESCESPLWLPANPALAEAVRGRTGFPNRYTLIAAFIGVVFAASFVAGSPAREPNYTAAACSIAPAALFVMTQMIHSFMWGTLDETAVYTIIPIDHMYDVKHRGKHGAEWYESYLVFYQPDGRYTLHAKDGDGDANCVVIVKYHGLVTWLPYREERNLM